MTQPSPSTDAVLFALMNGAELIHSEWGGDFFLIPCRADLLDAVIEAMSAFEDDEEDDPPEDNHDAAPDDHCLVPVSASELRGPDEDPEGWKVSRLTAAE